MAENIFVQEPPSSVNRLEIKRYGYRLEFVISADGVDCHCAYDPATTGGTPLTEEELQGFLAQFKISEGIIPEAIASLLHAAACAKAVAGHLVARGSAMVPGKDGYLDLVVTDDTAAKAAGDDDSGTVDLHHVQSFLNVETGGLVAVIHPPEPGISGKSVFGKLIAPQSGAPLKLELGQNVRYGDDGLSIYAETTGRVYCRGNEISVADVYEVDGDVDFKVGDISFKGFVEVKGDVLDGFTVKATKGIKVQGNIGVCVIESEGDILIGGMNGQGKGTIRCGGSLTANFIYDTSIECAGDVSVEIEIRNSHIRSLGAIRVNKGGLAGGEYFALAGIESSMLGNISSLRTRVVAGVHYRDLEEINQLFNELKLLVSQFTAAPTGTADLKDFARKRMAFTERTQEVRLRTHEQCNPKINIKKTLYEGVNITLGMVHENVKEERKGPLSVIENSIEGGFRFLGMTALSFKGQAIEQTFIQQHLLEQQNRNNDTPEEFI